MPDNEQIVKDIQTISNRIYQQAKQYNFVLSPQSYFVWYEYNKGENLMLNSAIQQMIEKKEPFTIAFIDRLYAQHFKQDDKKIMNQVQVETQRIIKDMLDGMLSMTDASNAYEQKLAIYSKDLTQADGITKVKDIVGSIIADTQKMAETNRQLQDEFEKSKNQTETLNKKLVEIETVASTDALTGLFNRRTFDKEIQNLLDNFKKSNETFSVIILDIDHFKKFNDTFGHKVGDEVLQSVGSIIKKGVKGRDIPTRYGGEEFVVLLPETACNNACILAEHLRIRIAVCPLKDKQTSKEIGKITASFGVAEIKPEDDGNTIIERADRALYAAKEAGRNNTKSELDLL